MKTLLAILAGITLIGCNSAASRYMPKDIQHNLCENYKFESFGTLPFGIQYKTYISQTNKDKVRYIYVFEGKPYTLDIDFSKNLFLQDGQKIDAVFPVFMMRMNSNMKIRNPGDSYPGGIIK